MDRLDRRKTILWVLLVTGLGAVLRLAAFGSVPGGLYQDEAFNGLDALRVLDGELALHFPANNGREPLFIYLASLSVAGLGRTPAAVRLPAAFLGTLTIPILAALGAGLFNRRVGLLGATLMAISFWPLHLSRVAFRAVGLPLFIGLALAAGWHGVRRRNRWWVLLGGISYGLGFYTYLPIYLTPVVLALFAFYLWLVDLKVQLKFALPWFLLGTAASLVPLSFTLLTDSSLLWVRAAQVSILDPAVNYGDLWASLFQQIGRGIGIYLWQGDMIPRHNLPGRPVFDLVMAPFFLLGLFWAVRRWRRPAAFLVVMWSLLMLSPTILAKDAPHFLRAVGVLPVACLLPALGLDRFYRWMQAKASWRCLPAGATVLVLTISLALTVRDYFGRYAADPWTGYAYQAAAVELADQMDGYDGPVWASVRFPDVWESVRYLVEKDVYWIPEGAAPQDISLPAAWFIWPYEPIEPQLAVLPPLVRLEGWQGPLVKGDREAEPYPLYWAYQIQLAAEPSALPVAHFENGIILLAAAAQPVGLEQNELKVALEWSTEAELNADYQVFVHVTDETGMTSQHDGPPAEGTLPTTWWRPGDQIVDVRRLSLPVAYRPGVYQVQVGLYQSDNQQRVAVLDAAGLPGDSVTLDLK